jgi:cytochrome b561
MAVVADAPDGKRYTEVAQHLHWLTPPIVLAQVVIAWVMLSLPPKDATGGLLFDVHKSLGVTIWLVIAVRLAWRFTHPAPPPGREMPRWLDLLGRANHWLMYLVLFGMPISGYVMSAMGPHGVSLWGLPLPRLPKVESVQKLAETGHYLAQWALYALVLLHVAATVYHVAVRRDGLLQRMIPAQVNADPD